QSSVQRLDLANIVGLAEALTAPCAGRSQISLAELTTALQAERRLLQRLHDGARQWLVVLLRFFHRTIRERRRSRIDSRGIRTRRPSFSVASFFFWIIMRTAVSVQNNTFAASTTLYTSGSVDGLIGTHPLEGEEDAAKCGAEELRGSLAAAHLISSMT